jgi:hypothetical protein
MDEIQKDINDYQEPILTKNFLAELSNLMKTAEENKNKEPKSEKTRFWAVVYTDLEKTLAYAEKNLP